MGFSSARWRGGRSPDGGAQRRNPGSAYPRMRGPRIALRSMRATLSPSAQGFFPMAWEKATNIFQLIGALLGIPAAAAGAYAVYRSHFSPDVACQGLRTTILF